MKKGIATVGGTFDHLHDGHRALILEAFRLAEKVIVGITSDTFAKSEGKRGIATFPERKKIVQAFLTSKGLADRATIVKLEDRLGPLLSQGDITHVVVTRETYPAALEANGLRIGRGIAPVKIHVLDFVLAQDGRPISSSRIRKGEIDPSGRPIKH